jgi:hypothetical protein
MAGEAVDATVDGVEASDHRLVVAGFAAHMSA